MLLIQDVLFIEVLFLKATLTSSSPQMSTRTFILLTTFPNKQLTDMGQTLAEANLLNAVVVQRFQ